jgi:hypothetical protein
LRVVERVQRRRDDVLACAQTPFDLVLAEIRRLAEGPLAESFADADRNPPVFDPATHSVTLPESFKKSVRALEDGEWYRLDLPDELGGFGAPRAAPGRPSRWCSAPTPPSSCTAPGPLRAVLHELGTEDQKKLAELMIERQLGRHDGAHRARRRLRRRRRPHQGRAAARRLLAHHRREAVHHLGRARPERQHRPPGAGPPRGREARAPRACRCSSSPSSTSTSRPASSASATAPTSPTSRRRWASRSPRPASSPSATTARSRRKGWLVGDVHDGIAQMFKVIEYARMMVGTKAIATLSTGYLNALDYAKTACRAPT